ncbi:MAG: hypothetical protein EON48_18330, partial [Acetobacteraceae bacterium]
MATSSSSRMPAGSWVARRGRTGPTPCSGRLPAPRWGLMPAAMTFATACSRVPSLAISQGFSTQFIPMKQVGDTVTRFALTAGNSIEILSDGDAAYTAIARAIAQARHSIILETYIFDRDRVGLHIADLLIAAHERGVSVRVLIDSVGARYSVPSIVHHLRGRGVRTATFNGKVITGLRLPYANLRTHRK